MKMYHGTTSDKWENIQKEKILWGIRNAPSRCTYLAIYEEDAKKYGDILLEVEFDPIKDIPNNWVNGAWQCRVYAPIPIESVKRIS